MVDDKLVAILVAVYVEKIASTDRNHVVVGQPMTAGHHTTGTVSEIFIQMALADLFAHKF